MQRREFLAAAAASTLAPSLLGGSLRGDESHAHCGPGFASPAEAMKAAPETLLYTVAL